MGTSAQASPVQSLASRGWLAPAPSSATVTGNETGWRGTTQRCNSSCCTYGGRRPLATTTTRRSRCRAGSVLQRTWTPACTCTHTVTPCGHSPKSALCGAARMQRRRAIVRAAYKKMVVLAMRKWSTSAPAAVAGRMTKDLAYCARTLRQRVWSHGHESRGKR